MKKVRDIKKPNITIDMTPMVDVIMLLLTFFMLTATFKAAESEAVEVALPQSVYSDPDNKMKETDVMTLSLTKEGDVFLDVDNYKIREKIFGDQFGIGLYHPDSLSQSQVQKTGKVGEKEIKRKVYVMNKAQFEKTLVDIKSSLKSISGNKSAQFQVVVKGDKDVPYGVFEDLMTSLHESDNKVFSLVTMIKADKKE
ncbi:MAG: biopolymer transporter ExbD [Ignavibacteriota bacterium]|nr:biopolymer transporter ExbD [Ignavibacteriota bacterium]